MPIIKGTITVCDKNGLHARPAGQLVNMLRSCGAAVTLTFGDKTADGTKLFSVMALGAGYGDAVAVTLEGELTAAEKLSAFCRENPAFSLRLEQNGDEGRGSGT
ncbi:MAG: HPr family phosphocarrier protein [Clostridia bacterium]|nr:HPr family phosphocarrier protein [Clostridia bacterium]